MKLKNLLNLKVLDLCCFYHLILKPIFKSFKSSEVVKCKLENQHKSKIFCILDLPESAKKYEVVEEKDADVQNEENESKLEAIMVPNTGNMTLKDLLISLENWLFIKLNLTVK